MLELRIAIGRFVLLDLAAFALVPKGAPEELVEGGEKELVLPFGFADIERAQPAPDPVFRSDDFAEEDE